MERRNKERALGENMSSTAGGIYCIFHKPWALVRPPAVSFSMTSECSGTAKGAEGGWLPIATGSVVSMKLSLVSP